MNKNFKIHIFGASGSGVTTLGKRLSTHLQIPFFDADDFYWKRTNPPFTQSTDIEERKNLLKEAVSQSASWLVSGSLTSWSDTIQNEFDFVIYLYVSKEERVRRIKKREAEKFGHRIQLGGDMYEGHLKFLEWAGQYDEGFLSGRSKPRHELWMATLNCPVFKISGDMSEQEVFEKAKALIL